MCGRFGFAKNKDEVKKRFNLKKLPNELPLLYNIAPYQNVPAVLNESPDELSMIQWQLLPSWSKEEKTAYSMINARAETLLEKPTFKRLVQSKRCLILADGFYEWKKVDGAKEPYRIMLKNDELFAFAGIWDRWENKGKIITSCCIITTLANNLVKEIHDRMPVILPIEKEEEWLGDLKLDKLSEFLKPYKAKEMTAYRISKSINSPTNNSVNVIQPVD